MRREIGQREFSWLADRFGGQLLDAAVPLAASLDGGDVRESAAALARLRNPYVIEDDPGAFHTTGWHGAYVSRHSRSRSPLSRQPISRRPLTSLAIMAPGW